jgi:tetratricopeptide (TPR) repeat protein
MADFLHDNEETLMKYLDGDMDETEKDLFEGRLQSDTELKERLQNLQLAIASVQQYGTAEKVKSIHSEMMQELASVEKEGRVVPMKRAIRYTLAIAASIIIILIGVNIFTAGPSSQKLYNEAFVDYDASGVRGNNSRNELATWYQNHDYKAVTEKAASQNLSQTDSLLVAISYLKTDKTSEAIQWLKNISLQNPINQDAEFYLAMAYLKNKNYDEAVSLMEQIHANPNQVYRNQFSEDYINKVKTLK